MSGLEDRIRKLERQLARLDVPSLEEVGAAFGRAAARAWAKYRSEPQPYEEQRTHDQDVIERWAQSEGIDLDVLAERARQKLEALGGGYGTTR